jgi:hypothetical protein
LINGVPIPVRNMFSFLNKRAVQVSMLIFHFEIFLFEDDENLPPEEKGFARDGDFN